MSKSTFIHPPCSLCRVNTKQHFLGFPPVERKQLVWSAWWWWMEVAWFLVRRHHGLIHAAPLLLLCRRLGRIGFVPRYVPPVTRKWSIVSSKQFVSLLQNKLMSCEIFPRCIIISLSRWSHYLADTGKDEARPAPLRVVTGTECGHPFHSTSRRRRKAMMVMTASIITLLVLV